MRAAIQDALPADPGTLPSERAAEEQIERPAAVFVEAGAEVHRPQWRVHAEEQAAVLAQVAQAGIVAVHPGVARLERQADVGGKVEHAGPATADLLVVEQAPDAVVRPAQKARRQTGEIPESA